VGIGRRVWVLSQGWDRPSPETPCNGWFFASVGIGRRKRGTAKPLVMTGKLWDKCGHWAQVGGHWAPGRSGQGGSSAARALGVGRAALAQRM